MQRSVKHRTAGHTGSVQACTYLTNCIWTPVEENMSVCAPLRARMAIRTTSYSLTSRIAPPCMHTPLRGRCLPSSPPEKASSFAIVVARAETAPDAVLRAKRAPSSTVYLLWVSSNRVHGGLATDRARPEPGTTRDGDFSNAVTGGAAVTRRTAPTSLVSDAPEIAGLRLNTQCDG